MQSQPHLDDDLPVQFFEHLNCSWIKSSDVFPFQENLQRFTQNKNERLNRAVHQAGQLLLFQKWRILNYSLKKYVFNEKYANTDEAKEKIIFLLSKAETLKFDHDIMTVSILQLKNFIF